MTTQLLSPIYHRKGSRLHPLQLYCYRCGNELYADVYSPPIDPYDPVWAKFRKPIPAQFVRIDCEKCGFRLYDHNAECELWAAYDEVERNNSTI